MWPEVWQGLWAGPWGSGDAAFDPVNLFSGEAGYVIDMQRSTLWQDEARTTQATADGDLVWWIDDLSGNGKHWEAQSSLYRGILRIDGGTRYLECNSQAAQDGAVYLTPAYPSAAAWTTVVGFRHVDVGRLKFALRGTPASGEPIFLMGQDGISNSAFRDTNGTATVRADAASITDSRDSVYAALGDGVDHVATVEGYAYAGDWLTNPTSHLAFEGGASGYFIEGRFYGDVEIARALTADERDSLESWMAQRSGASLS